MRFLIALVLLFFVPSENKAQLYFKGALKANREKVHRNLVQQTINRNLSFALSDSTEENWQSAFNAMEVLRYRNMWIDGKIKIAADQLPLRSIAFQRSTLE